MTPVLPTMITAAFQFLAALLAGICYYMVAMVMTSYDGFVSMVLQPFAAVILTTIGIAIIGVAGLPIRLSRALRTWWMKHWWISFIIGSIAFAMMVASWHPSLRIQVWNPDLKCYQDSFHPLLSIGGWLLTLFGAFHFYPPLGFLRKPAEPLSDAS